MKNKYLSKKYWKDQSTPMGKVNELASGIADIVDLALGDSDFTTSELIINATFNDALAGHTKYTDFCGDPELRAEIVKFYMEEYDAKIMDEQVFITPGGCMAMYLALEAVLDDDDEVILQAPYHRKRHYAGRGW